MSAGGLPRIRIDNDLGRERTHLPGTCGRGDQARQQKAVPDRGLRICALAAACGAALALRPWVRSTTLSYRPLPTLKKRQSGLPALRCGHRWSALRFLMKQSVHAYFSKRKPYSVPDHSSSVAHTKRCLLSRRTGVRGGWWPVRGAITRKE